MPAYDYACSKCGHTFEIRQSMNDAPLRKCPSCGKPALKRLVGGGAGLIFKGSGFYITDYKRKPEPKSESKPESKPDSKPEPKPEPKPGADKKPSNAG